MTRIPRLTEYAEPRRPTRGPTRIAIGCTVFLLAASAHAQLRIVTYNTATGNPSPGVQTARPGSSTVLSAIGSQSVNGISKPIDILLLQEQHTVGVSTQSFVNLMNSLYGTNLYERGVLDGDTNSFNRSGGAPAIVFNSATVELLEEIKIGIVGDDDQPRSSMRYKLRPVGYGDAAVFYVYNSHYKSDTASTDEARRLQEAQAVRADADNLPAGTHILYVGDFNIQSHTDDMYQWLTTTDGAGKAFDPIGQSATWHNNDALRWTHTQAPLASGASGLIGGGVDDRFDFQLVNSEFGDGLGMSIIEGSYRPFGNDGSHTCCNSSIDTGTGYSPAILSALMTASDHLPVVADYQLPAAMQVVADSAPAILPLGQAFSLDVTVSNSAHVVAAIGADLLRYSLTTTGDLSGTYLNRTDAALGGGNLHLVGFDTSTPGLKSGSIHVASTSQQVANGIAELLFNYQVVLPGDYNGDNVVNAADYVTWRNSLNQSVAAGLGADGNFNGMIDGGDWDVWQARFGESYVTGASAAVPEPPVASAALLLIAAMAMHCLYADRRLRFYERRLSHVP